MQSILLRRLMRVTNALCMIGISMVLLAAFWFQFVLEELPCPLCLLQRLGLLAIGFGFMLNVHYRPRPVHYSLSLLAAVATAMAAMRQILLHISPGDPGYGSTVFGLHMYTWVFLLACAVIIYCALILSIASQYQLERDPDTVVIPKARWLRWMARLSFAIFVLLLAANSISLFYECGLQECPDNPHQYRLVKQPG